MTRPTLQSSGNKRPRPKPTRPNAPQRQSSSAPRECITIGRHAANELRLFSHQVSKRHCRLRRTMGGWLLEDLGSKNGTWVGGARILRKRVEPGLVFRVADVPVRIARDGKPEIFTTPRSRTKAAGWPWRLLRGPRLMTAVALACLTSGLLLLAWSSNRGLDRAALPRVTSEARRDLEHPITLELRSPWRLENHRHSAAPTEQAIVGMALPSPE